MNDSKYTVQRLLDNVEVKFFHGLAKVLYVYFGGARSCQRSKPKPGPEVHEDLTQSLVTYTYNCD